jgi:hypothetical protein
MKRVKAPKLKIADSGSGLNFKSSSKLDKLTEHFLGLNKCCGIRTAPEDKCEFASKINSRNLASNNNLRVYVRSRLANAYYKEKFTLVKKPDKFSNLVVKNHEIEPHQKTDKTKKATPANAPIYNKPKDSKISSKPP